MTEVEMVKQAKAGNKAAFSQLYGLYKDKLYRYAYYKLGNIDDAIDAVSDTVLCAYEQIGKLRKEASFSSWIFKIHYVTCTKYISMQMQKRSQLSITQLDNCNTLSNNLNTNCIELNECLDILKDNERDIVLLSVVAGLNSREISKLIGIKDGTVRSILSRSLSKMRNFMG